MESQITASDERRETSDDPGRTVYEVRAEFVRLTEMLRRRAAAPVTDAGLYAFAVRAMDCLGEVLATCEALERQCDNIAGKRFADQAERRAAKKATTEDTEATEEDQKPKCKMQI